jgi:hypothetical protein
MQVGMARRPGNVDLSHEQLLQAVGLLNQIERATADIARDKPELDEFVGDVRHWLREVRTIRTPTPNHTRCCCAVCSTKWTRSTAASRFTDVETARCPEHGACF